MRPETQIAQAISMAIYQHGLTRFSLANKDAHVSRIYQRIFHPYHCPAEAVLSEGLTRFVSQADDDCDGFPENAETSSSVFIFSHERQWSG